MPAAAIGVYEFRNVLGIRRGRPLILTITKSVTTSAVSKGFKSVKVIVCVVDMKERLIMNDRLSRHNYKETCTVISVCNPKNK